MTSSFEKGHETGVDLQFSEGRPKAIAESKRLRRGWIQVVLPVGGPDDNRLALLLEAIQLPQQHPQQPPCGFMHISAPAESKSQHEE